MEARTPIPFTIDTDLIQDCYYIVEVKEGRYINFTYDYVGNSAKPFKLDNNCRLNHIPTLQDTGVNNLKPVNICSDYTEEEKRQILSKAGKRSQENHLKRKTFKESFEMILSLKASKEQLKNISDDITKYLSDEDIENLTQEDLITLKALELSQLGSEKHQVFVRDTVGEKPTDRQELTADIMTDGDRALLNKLQDRLNV